MQGNATTTALRDHGKVQEWGRKARKAENRNKRGTIKRAALRAEIRANG